MTLPERSDMPVRFRNFNLVMIFGLLAGTMSSAMAQDAPTLPNQLTPETVEIIQGGLKWLASQQRPNGAFGASDESTESVGVTALAGMAFLSAGNVPGSGEYADVVTKALDYILGCSQQNGYLFDSQGTSRGPMYGHGFGTMFLAELYGMSPRPDLGPKLDRAVELIIATQNKEGGWRYYPVPDEADISVTVCQVMALRAARNSGIGVPKEVIDRAVAYLKECQNSNGGFRYRRFDPAESKLARTAAAVAAMYSAGISDEPGLRRGLDFVEKELKSRHDRDYYFYAQYYAGQVAWQAGGEYWETCFPILRDDLTEQALDGHWQDRSVGDEYATAMALIVLQLPYDLVPIFER